MSANESTGVPKFVTRNVPFFKCNSAGQNLFAIQKGVPAEDALSWTSCILASVIGLLAGIEGDDEVQGAVFLVQIAKAAIDSVGVSDD